MSKSQDLVIDAGIMREVSCNNAHGDTLLHWAVFTRTIPLLSRLLQNGVLTNLPNDDGRTPLHLAVSLNSLAMCKLLIAAGANLHARDKQGLSPADLAVFWSLECQFTNESILEFFLQKTNGSTEHQDALFRALCLTIVNCKSMLTDAFLRQAHILLDRDPKKSTPIIHVVLTATENMAPLESLVAAGFDVNSVDGGGATALHVAAQMRNTDTLKYLIRHGATVDAIDYGHRGTPLFATIFGAKPDNARVLIEAGANVFYRVGAGRPLLHLAAQEGQLEILELMLSAGVPVNTLDEIGETAAYWACESGHLECIELLLLHGVDLRAGKVDLMEQAIRQRSLPIVECLQKHGLLITEQCLYLLQNSGDISPCDWEMLYFFLRHLRPRRANEGDTENGSSGLMSTVERWLSLGLINAAAAMLEIGYRPGNLDDLLRARLLVACSQHGFLSATRALLSGTSSLDMVRRFCFEPHHWRALEVAVYQNDVESVKLFLEHDWDPNHEDTQGRTSLHLAALHGASDVVKELLCECDAHHRDKERNTVVHLGAYNGSVQVLELLVTSKEDLDKTNKAGETPLGIACERGHTDAVQWLLDQGSRHHIRETMHLHPLHLSSRHDHVSCIDILIASGFDADARYAGGNTPLHDAATNGAWKAVSRLLQAGADPNCANHQGMTPLAMALLHPKLSHDTFIELFQKCSVDWDTPLSQNIIFTSCIGGNQDIITAVFARLRQERPKTAKKTVRSLLPELLAELCSSELAAGTAFPFLLEYMHSSSKEAFSTKILTKAIQDGDDAKLAQTLVDINPKNAYLSIVGLWSMLHLACRYGRIKIARVLLANGAPVWAENDSGLSPLGVAKKYLRDERLEEFLCLFRGYEAALTVLREYHELQNLVLATKLRIEDEKQHAKRKCHRSLEWERM